MADDQLRDRIAAAITEDALKPPVDRVGIVNAMLAVVQPELDQLRAERDAARAQVAAVALVRVWRNEDGKEFLFANDIRGALGVAADPTTT